MDSQGWRDLKRFAGVSAVVSDKLPMQTRKLVRFLGSEHVLVELIERLVLQVFISLMADMVKFCKSILKNW